MVSELTLTLKTSPDVEEGVVRLDPSDMRLLNVIAGDYVALTGLRTAYARVLPSFMEDRNQRLASINDFFLRNTGLQSGHKVQINAERKRPRVAESITLRVEDELDLLHVMARQKQLGTYWQERAVVAEDWLRVPSLDQYPLPAQVIKTSPDSLVHIGHGTRFIIETLHQDEKLTKLGGLRGIYRLCRKLVQSRLKSGLKDSASTILLTGPSGCGKARLVKRLGEEVEVPVVTLDVHHMLDKKLASNSHELDISLTDIARRGSVILLLDNLQALVPHDNAPSALVAASRVVVAQLCALLDEAAMQPTIMVFATVSGPIEPRFIEGNRFEVVLPVDAPNMLERYEVLYLATRGLPLADKVDLMSLAEMTSGAVARDLCQLAATASRIGHASKITENDFILALRHNTYPVAEDVRCDIPTSSWNDIGGLDDIKQLLRDTLSWSLTHRERFVEAGVKPPRSILLSGGIGTGKTSLVRALANIIPINFIEMACSTLASCDPLSSVRSIKDIFALARRKAPCLVFFDDIDFLFESMDAEGSRGVSPITAQMLNELDGLALMPGVVVVAATNRPDRLSEDILQPGRFDFAVTLPMPDYAARKKILHIHARKLPLAADIDYDRLANVTQGMSPAEIATLCNRVGLMALRQSLSSDHGSGVPPVANAALFEQVMRGRKG